MKSITSIACTAIIAFTLTAFTYSNWNDIPTYKLCIQTTQEIEPPTFFYDLSPRYKNTITKERIHNAQTVSDLIPEYSIQENLRNNIISLKNVKIGIEEKSVYLTKIESEDGDGNRLSNEQINLLKSTDYSTNFLLEGYSTHNNPKGDLNTDRYFNYYMTVIPEQQASYNAGNNAFIDYLKSNCAPTIIKVQKGNLKSGKISLTITKAGHISDVNLISTCGYSSVDEKMMDLMNTLPDVWNVATNGKGEKVNQSLVFSYGQTGC